MKKTILNLRKQCLRRLAAFAALGFFAVTAQAQVVTWTSSDQAVATVDANGTVTPVSYGTVTITATITQNGKTATSSKTVDIDLSSPPITINGVKWAQGNVTFDPSSCTNGTCTKLMIATNPYDRGLYFQWGGDGAHVIGYAKSGTWNVTPNVNDTSTWRYVQPGATFPSSYPMSYSDGYNSRGTTKGEWTVNNPCTLIGGWRLPTRVEYTSLSGSNMAGWTYSSSNGGYVKHTVTGLVIPTAFFRGKDGGYLSTGGYGHWCWSSTEDGIQQAYNFHINDACTNIYINSNNKGDAATLRCVKD